MRPIDADAMIAKTKRVLEKSADKKGSLAYFAFEIFIELIESEPTIDPDTLRPHGEWKFGKNHGEFVEATCTVCDGILLVKWYDELSHFRFCPNCGADMRGEKE